MLEAMYEDGEGISNIALKLKRTERAVMQEILLLEMFDEYGDLLTASEVCVSHEYYTIYFLSFQDVLEFNKKFMRNLYGTPQPNRGADKTYPLTN